MKHLALTLTILMSVNVFAAESKIVCTPTIAAGNVNFQDENSGLNRISSIEVTNGEAGYGGYGIVVRLAGTAGTGDKAATATFKLPWASAYGSDLIEYNNAMDSKSTLAKPFIVFEMEHAIDSKNFLAALTFSSAKDSKSARIYNSRYTCQSN